MVWSLAYDYMHGILLGVTLQLWNLWKNGTNGQFKISEKDVKYIENRYLHITPIQNIHRLPRKGIIYGTAKPKASELKAWLLYYSLPCLEGVVEPKLLEHYTLLVNSTYILLKEKITEEELNQCEQDFQKFVYYYELYYGEEQMTLNVHTLLHVVDSIRQTGLYVNSAYYYENYIGKLKNFVTGPKGADLQMAREHLQKLFFMLGSALNNSISIETIKYCQKFFASKRLTKYYEQTQEKVTFCGKKTWVKIEGTLRPVYKKCIII